MHFLDAFSFEITYFDAGNRVGMTTTAEPGWHFADGSWSQEELGLCFRIEEQRNSSGRRLVLPRGGMQEQKGNRFRTLAISHPLFAGKEGDDGALFLPLDTGMLCHTRGKQEKEYLFPVFCEREWDIFWCNMAFFGRYANGKGCGVALEDGKFDCQLRLRTAWGAAKEYAIAPLYLLREWPEESLPKDGIALTIGEMEECGDWLPLAGWYQTYVRSVRGVPTLAQRCRENKDLLYSTRAMTVRCRLAVKKLPTPILEQKPDNQPPMRVYMNYDDVRAIAKKFQEYSIGPSEFCMVGWNYGGHDGAFPQLFPVCQEVGSEQELLQACREVTEKGYRFNLHDNYYDAYTLASNLDLEDLCASDEPYHMPVHGGGLLGGGRAYRICGQRALEYARRNLAEVHSRLPGLSGTYFSDVISLIASCKCAHPQHPESRAENAAAYEKILELQHQYYGVSSSEGGRDWSIPALDRAYMLINKPGNEKTYDYTDEAVPLYQIVYHNLLIYNTFRSGINAWPESEEYLLNIAYGGLPTIYYHHLFNPDWGASSGCKIDLDTTPQAIAEDMPLIQHISRDVARIADLQQVDIQSIRRKGDFMDTLFADGRHICTNFGDRELTVGITKIPPHDFVVL